ncbi:TIGR00266 family protein [Hahella sp. CCB-MM4]|uniref:TIGR00266 family protein n=1 Tax=Hahella sp. (strain CCB-MM4) TaxID=1926491 RepID=UPI000B9A3246|nr:TIGR00266 family protein [Hahella sp. CCB-MM4]OZG71553.1 TIGR00266 family protein [Hahella sp. CCB-MM4]
MNTTAYQVRVTGELNDGVTRESAVDAFSKLFKVATETAENIFSKAPVVVKKGIDQPTADKIHKALNNIGVQNTVELAESAQSVQSQTPAENDSASTVERAIEKSANKPPVSRNEPMNLKQEPSGSVEEDQPGFKFKVEGRPDYAFLTVNIPANKTLRVEASAMATMDTNLVMKTKAKGGLGRLLTSESIFINEFTAQNGPGEIGIAPASPGDLAHVYLKGETVFLQNSAFVASDLNVQVETKWQGLTKGFFSGESLFLIRCSGDGDLWFNTYGGMIMLDVDGDYVVDTGNIVAFTEGLDYSITKVGGYKSLFFSGEGFVCRFSGKGKVWIQTRSVQAFTSWMYPFRPVEKKN